MTGPDVAEAAAVSFGTGGECGDRRSCGVMESGDRGKLDLMPAGQKAQGEVGFFSGSQANRGAHADGFVETVCGLYDGTSDKKAGHEAGLPDVAASDRGASNRPAQHDGTVGFVVQRQACDCESGAGREMGGYAGEQFRLEPAVVVGKADDGSGCGGDADVAGARRAFGGAQVQQRKADAVPGENFVEPSRGILVHEDDLVRRVSLTFKGV